MDLLDQKYPQTELLAKAREIISRVQIFEEMQALRTRLQGLGGDIKDVATIKSLERQLNLLLNGIAKDFESDVPSIKKFPAVIRREEIACTQCGYRFIIEDLISKDNPYSEDDRENTPCGQCTGGFHERVKIEYCPIS